MSPDEMAKNVESNDGKDRTERRLSHGGRYYRVHRGLERIRKRAERARWEGFLKAFQDRNPDLRIALDEFKAEVRRSSPDHRAHLPSHSPARGISRREQELRRETANKFLGTDYGPSEFETRYGGHR